MNLTPDERLRNIIPTQQLPVQISEGQRLRLLAYMERANREIPEKDGRYDLDDPADLLIAVDVLMMRALEASEDEAGLRFADWGEPFSKDVAEEMIKRWRERFADDA